MGVKQKPVVSHYVIKSNTSIHLRIALLADLHEEDGSSVINILRSLSPNMILMPGDIMETYHVGLKQQIYDEYQIYLKQTGRKVTDPKFQSLYAAKVRFPGLYFVVRIFIHSMGYIMKKLLPKKKKHGMEFLKEVRTIAPCYFSRGNHDMLLEKVPSGIKLLENEYVIIHTGGKGIASDDKDIAFDAKDIAANGKDIATGGKDTATGGKDTATGGKDTVIGGVSRRVDLNWLDEFARIPAYHILLCHYPELYEPLFKKRKIELIVSGHAHGGQIRIANRGLYAPGQGFLPKYTKGVYDNRLVVTTGLSNNGVVPRCQNPTEVVLIEI